jgi:hypothetical protein
MLERRVSRFFCPVIRTSSLEIICELVLNSFSIVFLLTLTIKYNLTIYYIISFIKNMIHIMSYIPSTLSSDILTRFSASLPSVLRFENLSLSSILRFSPRFVAIMIINLKRKYEKKEEIYEKKEEIYEKKVN